jgi:hypothetical protein
MGLLAPHVPLNNQGLPTPATIIHAATMWRNIFAAYRTLFPFVADHISVQRNHHQHIPLIKNIVPVFLPETIERGRAGMNPSHAQAQPAAFFQRRGHGYGLPFLERAIPVQRMQAARLQITSRNLERERR